jgi:hypothetical protein
LLHVRPRDLAVLPAASARSVRQIRKRLLMLAADRQSDRVFRRLIVDPAFYREFDESVPETASGSPDRH